jgi:hypothetical protein
MNPCSHSGSNIYKIRHAQKRHITLRKWERTADTGGIPNFIVKLWIKNHDLYVCKHRIWRKIIVNNGVCCGIATNFLIPIYLSLWKYLCSSTSYNGKSSTEELIFFLAYERVTMNWWSDTSWSNCIRLFSRYLSQLIKSDGVDISSKPGTFTAETSQTHAHLHPDVSSPVPIKASNKTSTTDCKATWINKAIQNTHQTPEVSGQNFCSISRRSRLKSWQDQTCEWDSHAFL